jgi:hypothetical protein
MKRILLVLITLTLVLPLMAQESGGGSGFSAGLNLGSDLLPNPDDPTKIESWSKLGFQPDLAIGRFGIGLDLTFRFQLYPADGSTPFRLYTPDWIPSGTKTIWDIYLPKVMYVRYGLRGVDPLYAKLGSINDFTLGNGLIVSNYSNTRFLPDLRLFGLQVGVDGAIFKVPYIGFEALTGNLAKLDVVGGRVFLRPLAFLGSSLLGRLQIGGTAVVDQNPLLYVDSANLGSYPASSLIYVLGGDVTLPILTGKALALTAFAEGAMEMNDAMGLIGGIRGKLLGFVNYGAQIRYLQEGFVPSYFDSNYDLYRAERFDYVQNTSAGAFTPGWFANLGFELFTSMIVFDAKLDGPFAPIPSVSSNNSAAYPHLRGTLVLKDDLIGGISFEGGYEKYFIGRNGSLLNDLIDPTDAIIGFSVNYQTGSTVLTLSYSYSWNPTVQDWDVSSSLSASVRF